MYKPAVDKRPRAGGASSTAEPTRGAGYAVYDPLGRKIGRAEEVFANRDGEPMYVRVRIGFFGTRVVLIPVQFVEMDDQGKTLTLK